MAAYEEQEYNKPFQMKIWAQMLPYFKPYKKYFFITFSLNIFLAAVDILVPLFQSYAINHFIVPDTLDGIYPFAIAYVALIAFQTISVYWSVHAATTIEMNIGKDLKWKQFEHLQQLSFSYYLLFSYTTIISGTDQHFHNRRIYKSYFSPPNLYLNVHIIAWVSRICKD